MGAAALLRVRDGREQVVAAAGPVAPEWTVRVPASAELALVLDGPQPAPRPPRRLS
jgi:hypothetical protein